MDSIYYFGLENTLLNMDEREKLNKRYLYILELEDKIKQCKKLNERLYNALQNVENVLNGSSIQAMKALNALYKEEL